MFVKDFCCGSVTTLRNIWQEEAEHGAAAEAISEGSEDVLSEDDDEEEQEQTDDEEQHERMLADVSAAIASSGSRAAARRRASTLLNEVYPESEYNLQPAVASAGTPWALTCSAAVLMTESVAYD